MGNSIKILDKSGKEWEIPVLEPEQEIDKHYLEALNNSISSDGCTDVPDFHSKCCCIIHDLGYRFKIDPWGNPVSRRTVDANLRKCMESKSQLGKFSPFAWTYWLGVRSFGRFFYKPKTKE